MYEQASQAKLYDPRFEHDACGIGAVVNVDGHADHAAVDQALRIVEKLEHRAGRDASGETGDGVGIMTQVPHVFFQPRSRCARYLAGRRARLWRRYVFLPAGET